MYKLTKAVLASNDIVLSHYPSDCKCPEGWMIQENLGCLSGYGDYLICRAKYKAQPDSCIIIGDEHFHEWNEVANHICKLLQNRDIDRIYDYIEDENWIDEIEEFITRDTFYIELIDNAISIEDEKRCALIINYIEERLEMELLGEIINCCIEDYYDSLD